MAEFDYDKLVKVLKREGEISQKAAADELDINVGQLSMLNFCRAKVDAKLYSTAPATAKSVKNLRDNEENRWELIAARVGLSLKDTKELYGGEAKARGSYIGRGRNHSDENGSSKTRSAGRTSGSKSKTAGAKSKTAAAPSGRSAGRGRKSKTASAGRSTGRSSRRSTAANPS
jgi:hypothetical protein